MSSSPGLNPEPADPQARKENHLPPKSYADAVEQSPDANETDGMDDVEYVEHVEHVERSDYDRKEDSRQYHAEVS